MKSFFYRRPRATVLLLLLIVANGVIGFFTLPRMEDPILPQRAAHIVTRFPGASAEKVESLVTIPLEEELGKVEGLKLIQSQSRPGISSITMEVADQLDEFIGVWVDVRGALEDAEVRFPSGALKPEFNKREARAYSMLLALTWESEAPMNVSVMNRYGKELEDLLRAIPGTEEVDLFGAPEEEIQVLLKPELLARHQITPSAVANQVGAQDVKTSAGSLSTDQVALRIELPEIDSRSSLSDIIVSADEGGRSVPLGEVASFRRGERTPPRSLVLVEGERALVVAAKTVPTKRVDLWAAEVKSQIADFEKSLPEGVKTKVLFDQSTFTAGRLDELQRNVLIGAALVALTVFLTMGFHSALAVSSALPLTTLVVLSSMMFMGVPIHQTSVTGLIIALGLLIDNAIVVTDELRHFLDKGYSMLEAIEKTVGYLFSPLLSSTITTVLAFMPLILMPGPAGEFVGSISITVISALIGSLFLSLTLIPIAYSIACSKLPQLGRPDRFWNSGISFGPLAKLFERTLFYAYRYPVIGILSGVALPLAGFASAGKLKEQFFPPSDRHQCEITVELPSGSALAQTESLVREVREFLLQQPEVERTDWYIGRSTPAFYYNLLGTRQGAPNYAQAMIVFKEDMESNIFGVQRRLQNELDDRFPSALIIVRQLEQGPPFEAPVEVELYGPDLRLLKELGAQVRLLMADIPEITHTRAALDDDLVSLAFEPDIAQLRVSGLTSAQISDFLVSSTDGVVSGYILEDTEPVQVRVRIDDDSRADLSAIKTLEPLPLLPIEQLGKLGLQSDNGVFTRRNLKRTNKVQGFLQAGVLPSIAVAKFKKRLEEADFKLPPGYELKMEGEAAKRAEAVGNLLASAGTLAILMCATLVLGLSSFRLAGVIGAVAALSVGLSLGALYQFGYPFGFMAIIGSMGLVGIAINDSIVVMAALQADPGSCEGDVESAVSAVMITSRHVFTTTATTVAGFLPLYMSGGSFWPPLAVAIAGGVSGATLLALFFVPPCFLVLRRFR